MIIRNSLFVLVSATSIAFPNFAHAVFIDAGNGMVYDTALDVTWLKDANHAMTSGYDNDGLMTWDQATAWSASLTVGGQTGWRLPTMTTPGSPRPNENGQVTPTNENEFGWLWYQLGGGDYLGTSADFVPFENIPFLEGLSEYYWTGIEYDSSYAWDFLIDCACWGTAEKSAEHYAWAVHSGNVAGVPEPLTILLTATGLAGIGFASRKNRSAQ